MTYIIILVPPSLKWKTMVVSTLFSPREFLGYYAYYESFSLMD